MLAGLCGSTGSGERIVTEAILIVEGAGFVFFRLAYAAQQYNARGHERTRGNDGNADTKSDKH